MNILVLNDVRKYSARIFLSNVFHGWPIVKLGKSKSEYQWHPKHCYTASSCILKEQEFWGVWAAGQFENSRKSNLFIDEAVSDEFRLISEYQRWVGRYRLKTGMTEMTLD